MSDDTERLETGGGPRRLRLWNVSIGVTTLVAASLCLLVWFPNDIGSGFFKGSLTGRSVPGDAFFPTILVGLMASLSLLLILSALRGGASSVGEPVGRITLSNVVFLLQCALLTGTGIVLINVTGPALVGLWNAFGGSLSSYRSVSATFPVHVSGFFLGGTFIASGFIFLARHRLRPLDIAVAGLSAAFLILVFDVLLHNVLLPPNGDL